VILNLASNSTELLTSKELTFIVHIHRIQGGEPMPVTCPPKTGPVLVLD